MPNNRKSIVFRMVFLGALGVNMAKCVSYGIENNVKNCNDNIEDNTQMTIYKTNIFIIHPILNLNFRAIKPIFSVIS